MPLPEPVSDVNQEKNNLVMWSEIEKLNNRIQAREVTTVTADATLGPEHSVVLCDATSGAITITLPLAVVQTGRIFHIKKIDSSSNAVTIDGNGSETIDGSATLTLPSQYDSLMIISNASNWYVI